MRLRHRKISQGVLARHESPVSGPFLPFGERSLPAQLRRPRPRSATSAIRRLRPSGVRKKRPLREGLANGSYPSLCCRSQPTAESESCANTNHPRFKQQFFIAGLRFPSCKYAYHRRAQAAGAKSLRQIAAALNARGIATARGGKWEAQTVANVLRRVG